ncbi:MAG: polysaccharide pyruvyl transferase family protein [Bacteroidales bacterium]|nr:polysaccharide pyruvyl transferase family protein [Bacteroidales bacterium]
MKRVLILTHALHNNYGGLLQAFALQKTVKKLGFHAVTNDCYVKRKRNIFKTCLNLAKRIVKMLLGYSLLTKEKQKTISQNTQKFIDKFIETQHIENLTDDIADEFDIILVGSDQVFRKAYVDVTQYFLQSLECRDDKTKIAYAASFGTDDLSEWTQNEIEICKTLAPKFKAISVREDSGVEIFKKYFDTKAELVLDPTLLLEREDYLKTIDEEDIVVKNNVLMCYVLDKTSEKTHIINQIKEQTGLNLLEIMPEETFNKNTKDITKCIYPSVSKWLAGFRDASFVITDSFHGTVFSIIFNKPFVCIANKERGLSRFTSLLKIFGLEDRLIFSQEDLSKNLLDNIDYNKVNSVKREWQAMSIKFLQDNINKICAA